MVAVGYAVQQWLPCSAAAADVAAKLAVAVAFAGTCSVAGWKRPVVGVAAEDLGKPLVAAECEVAFHAEAVAAAAVVADETGMATATDA